MRCSQLLSAVCCCVLLSGCKQNPAPAAKNKEDLTGAMAAYTDSVSLRDRYTAFYLLSDVNVEPADIERVETVCKTYSTDLDKLFCAYFTYNKTQTLESKAEFVKYFPSTEQTVSTLFLNTLNVEMPTKLIDLMQNLAADDDVALAKLIVANSVADGWVAESLDGTLQELQKINPTRVAKVRKLTGVHDDSPYVHEGE